MQDRVIEQLNLVLEIDPHHIPTRERLKDLYLGVGDLNQAIQQLEALRDLFGTGKPHLARLYQDQIEALRSQPPPGPPEDALIFIEESVADIDLGHAAEPSTDVEPPMVADSPFDPPTPAPEAEDSPVTHVDPQNAEQARADAEAAARAAEAPAEIEDSLEEADFFITQGLLGEARTTLEDALEQNPGHILLREKLAEVALLENQQEPAEVVSLSEDSQVIRQTLVEAVGDVDDAFQDGSDIIDVGEVLGSLSENAPASPQDGPGNHLELGIAYKEMGLLDDAISEFETAAQQPEMACTALTMIGQCMVEKGEIDNAIARFKEALNIENIQPRDELTLYHALGMVYERAGNIRESRFYYEYVVKRDPTFRDVQSRLAQLEEGSGADASESSSDSVETNFKNLMRDQDG